LVLSLKEEGDSSHVNQAYDKFVAKHDKSSANSSLSVLRRTTTVNKGIIDQWGLIHVGLQCIRSTQPATWTSSFDACNLDPRTRVPFVEWCKKIQSFLHAGETFKVEKVEDDLFLLLPSFWHGMPPVERKGICNLINEKEGFTVECLQRLYSDFSIPFSEMQNLRVCYELAKADPSHLDRAPPDSSVVETQCQLPDEVKNAIKATTRVTEGLISFELKPAGVKGLELFDHMIKKRLRSSVDPVPPSEFLDCSINYSLGQTMIFNPSEMDVTARVLMQAAGGSGATMKLATRRLDNVGYIKAHSGLANDPLRLERMNNCNTLAASMAEITRITAACEDKKKKGERANLIACVPGAITKLKLNQMDAMKLTKKERAAVLLIVYGVNVVKELGKEKKPFFIKKPTDEFSSNPDVIDAYAGSSA
jgi:hypothetical protein